MIRKKETQTSIDCCDGPIHQSSMNNQSMYPLPCAMCPRVPFTAQTNWIRLYGFWDDGMIHQQE